MIRREAREIGSDGSETETLNAFVPRAAIPRTVGWDPLRKYSTSELCHGMELICVQNLCSENL